MIRADRRILHHCFTPAVLGQLRSANSNASYLLRIYGKGLTKKEKAYMDKQLEELSKITENIHKVYHRTKY